MTVKDLMIANVRAYNNVLTTEHCQAMTETQLMNNVHPSERLFFDRLLEKEKEENEQKEAELKSKSEAI
jgi:hypothetical protein